MLKNGSGDPRWGLRKLFEDLRSPQQLEEPNTLSQQVTPPPQQSISQPTQPFVSNIVNYPPMQGVPTQLKRFRFASVFTIILTVLLLTIVGLVAWKTGAIQHIIDVFRSLLT